MKVIGGDSVLFKSVQNVGLSTFSLSNCCYISGQEQAYRLVQFGNDSSFCSSSRFHVANLCLD